MNWLITGGCGFVGSNLADHLLEAGHEVAVLDNLSRYGSSNNLEWLRSRHSGFGYFGEDVRNAAAVARVVKELQPDAVAHLAGQVAATTSLENPRLDFEINAGGTFNVLDAVRLGRPEAIVLYSSTNKVYGSLEYLRSELSGKRYVLPDYPAGLDESVAVDPTTPYGCSKAAADQYVKDYFRMYGIRTVVFRHSSMYGGRQFATFDQGWVGWFCQQALRMRDAGAAPFTIAGDGMQVRDLLHSRDLIRCYTQAVRHIDRAAGEVFNIGGGWENSLSLLELFAHLEASVGVRMRFEKTPWRIADQKVFIAGCGKAKDIIQWSPEVSYRDGLEQAIEWAGQAG
ncbi:MAG: NAD-dependent epimerase/dehydratase family protein [Acidobacteriota bacterium]|jgi:CDP-paratose 2-epimerase|nr:GDP-mannose 4,6-dehydratase [Bryobacteraceae bacterium CoA2 C42]